MALKLSPKPMKVPILYVLRNLWVRKITTCLTAGGLSLVVFVFASILMLDEGLKKTLVNTGELNNIIVTRKGSDTEVQSGIYRNQAAIIENNPIVEFYETGKPFISKESVVLISLFKKNAAQQSNVVVRGTSAKGFQLRPQVEIVEGRNFRPGTREILIGSAISKGYAGARIGDDLYFAQGNWRIVGRFDAKNTAFDSEIWGDVEQLMQAFRRDNFSVLVFRSTEKKSPEQIQIEFDADPRLSQEVKREQNFYRDQSKALSKFINILGITLTIIFSIGATIGSMITMNATVTHRTSEIGTLRALGFKKKDILIAFLLESTILGALGGIFGISGSLLMEFSSFTTTNFQTFADLSFGFVMTPVIVFKALSIATIMGVIGGALPAIHAANLEIVDSLRSN